MIPLLFARIDLFPLLALMFIFMNPTILYYLPIIKKVAIYNKVVEQNYFEFIQLLIKKEKLYLNLKLTINDVSNGVGISKTNIRATILVNTEKNFNDYINLFRIEEAIKLIEANYLTTHTVVALGEKSGFNSHQSFFRAFKKIHDTTPYLYLNSLNKKGVIRPRYPQ